MRNLLWLHRYSEARSISGPKSQHDLFSRPYSHTLAQANHTLRVEVAVVGGTDRLTVTLDPGANQVVVFNGVDLTAHGYAGGQVGVSAYALTAERRVDNAKLWIDEAGGSSFDKQVFSDSFSSAANSPAHDDNGNLTDDGVFKYVYDAWRAIHRGRVIPA